MPVELHPHQQEAVDKMHNGCVLYGGVGVGKSITAMAYFVSKVCKGTYEDRGSMRTPKDIYVITTAKKRDSADWEKEAIGFGITTNPEFSIPGIKLTVDSWNNLSKYVEVKDAFFIFDEQRVVGYGAWSRAFIKIAKSNEWVLLSATPGDTWLDYIPVFIANGWYKHKTDFTDQHVIWTPRVKYPKVLRYRQVGDLVRRRNQVLVHMPYDRHTKRHAVDVWCDYDESTFDKVVKRRWHVYESRPLRDVAELFSVMRKVVNSDDSRARALMELSRRHPKLIVFYNFDYELEMLRELGAELSGTSETGLSDGTEVIGRTSSSSSQTTTSSTIPNSGSEPTRKSSPQQTKSCETFAELERQSTLDGRTTSSGDSESPLIEIPTELSHGCSGGSPTPNVGEPFGSLPEERATSGCAVVDTSTPMTIPNSVADGAGCEQTFAVAEWNGHKHQEIPATERWLYLVQYRAGAEGWNCIETDAMVFWSQTYSYRDWWQAHGRIDRINTPFTDLYYYHLISRSLIDKAIRAALKVKKSFNERDLAL